MRRLPQPLSQHSIKKSQTLNPKTLKHLHSSYLTRANQNPSHWTWLIKHYLSLGFTREPLIIYTKTLPHRTQQPILPLILKACTSLPHLPLGQSLHAETIKLGGVYELLVGTTFVSVYCKCGRVGDARKVFDEMPVRNVVTHNAMIGGYAANGEMGEANGLFEVLGLRSPVTWATMIDGFARAGDVVSAGRLFDRAPYEMRTVVTWTVMVHGYAVNGEMEAARELFDTMPVKNCFVWSSMITGYFKKCDAGEARAIFDRIPVRNLVNWNALIAGYTQHGHFNQALEAFREMLQKGFEPDEFTFASVLSACAQLGNLKQGKKIHELINRMKPNKNEFVSNGLVDMYAKCGDINSARNIFDGLRRRNDSCWNAMISGLASHGRSKEAIELFNRMQRSEVKPNSISFLVALSACTHAGFVDEGMELMAKMEQCGLVAGVQHYGCLVDMLGRAGRVVEAYEMVMKMPTKPNEIVWGALLGACRTRMDMEMAERVMERVAEGRESGGCGNDAEYMTVANVYAAAERWEAAESVRRKMVEDGVKKTPGFSSILAGDLEHQLECRD